MMPPEKEDEGSVLIHDPDLAKTHRLTLDTHTPLTLKLSSKLLRKKNKS